jgi:carboxypeptidase C (cathepsin A)
MFFVAYTRDGEDVKTRPVSFLYKPYHFVDNDNSLIDVTDLVFIDAISTGYSRTVPGVSSAQFHGQQGDLRAFGAFINEYLKTCGRWRSPKFLFGESYGTIRSAGLAQELQTRHGVELNGIVLISRCSRTSRSRHHRRTTSRSSRTFRPTPRPPAARSTTTPQPRR